MEDEFVRTCPNLNEWPEWAVCFAYDQSGQGHFYEIIPSQGKAHWHLRYDSKKKKVRDVGEYDGWRYSLVERSDIEEDSKYDLIKECNLLSKENEHLKRKLSDCYKKQEILFALLRQKED